jgi:hypothetical protein
MDHENLGPSCTTHANSGSGASPRSNPIESPAPMTVTWPDSLSPRLQRAITLSVWMAGCSKHRLSKRSAATRRAKKRRPAAAGDEAGELSNEGWRW